jgi:hypothetical protein
MEMAWKSHTKVSIGYHIVDAAAPDVSYVVFWYCPYKGADNYKKHSTISDNKGTPD